MHMPMPIPMSTPRLRRCLYMCDAHSVVGYLCCITRLHGNSSQCVDHTTEQGGVSVLCHCATARDHRLDARSHRWNELLRTKVRLTSLQNAPLESLKGISIRSALRSSTSARAQRFSCGLRSGEYFSQLIVAMSKSPRAALASGVCMIFSPPIRIWISS